MDNYTKLKTCHAYYNIATYDLLPSDSRLFKTSFADFFLHTLRGSFNGKLQRRNE
jgi:hypothetical protein